MKKTHYYLVDTSVVTPGAAVSELEFDIIHEEPFFVHGLKVRCSLSNSLGLEGVCVFSVLEWLLS